MAIFGATIDRTLPDEMTHQIDNLKTTNMCSDCAAHESYDIEIIHLMIKAVKQKASFISFKGKQRSWGWSELWDRLKTLVLLQCV